MTQVLAVNSFRSGAGSTHVAANLAVLLAQAGRRVGLIDADLRAPSLHFLFRVPSEENVGTLNDYLLGKSVLQEFAIKLPPAATIEANSDGSPPAGFDPNLLEAAALFFVPSEDTPSRYAELTKAAYDIERLRDGIHGLAQRLALDFLVLDTSAGVGQETLMTLALCDQLLIVLTLDRRELQGAGITMDAAQKLHVAETSIVFNKAPADYDPDSVRQQVSMSFGCDVSAILPYSDEIASLESRDLFTQRFPELPAAVSLRRLAQSILAR